MTIIVETIPADQHPYPTCGNWWWEKDGTLQIRVSKLGNDLYEYLIAGHEIDEAILCRIRGIKEESVSEFDKKFEAERDAGEHKHEDEPGDDERAPYRREHRFAENMERLRAHEMGVGWDDYSNSVELSL